MKVKKKRLSTAVRKEQIKEVILKILFEEGKNRLTTKYIAQKLGLSEGALFRHFSGKSDMFESILDDVIEQLIGSLMDIVVRDLTPKEKLKEFTCFTLTYLYNNKGITLLIFTEASEKDDTKLKQKLEYIYRQQKVLFIKIVREGIEAGIWQEKIDIDAISTLYMGIPVTMNLEILLHGQDCQIEKFCQNMQTIILKILA